MSRPHGDAHRAPQADVPAADPRPLGGQRREPVLTLEDVHVVYEVKRGPDVAAVAGVDLKVHAGEVTGLVGESGCGKSTLARAIVGLVPLARGRIMYLGRSVGAMGRRRRPVHLLGLQMIFQDPFASLNPRKRVRVQLEDGLRAADRHRGRSHQLDTVERLLRAVGLPEEAAESFPHEFSGGQRQRLSIARALAANPDVIIADEPVSALDVSTQAAVTNLLVQLCKRVGVALVFISHDLSLVARIAERVVVMYLGEVVEDAPREVLWTAPRHPYTRALLAAVPEIKRVGVLPAALAGEVPDPSRPPPGCRFHPRCPEKMDHCTRLPPRLQPLAGGSRVACWLYDTPDGLHTGVGTPAEHGTEEVGR